MADDRNCGCGQDPCITYGVNKNPMEIGPVDTYESQTLAAAAAQARADSAANEDGRAFMWSESRGVYKVSAYFPGKVDPQKVKTYTRLLSNPHSTNTSLKGIVSYLNKLSKKAIKDMAKTDSVDKNSRLSLMVFIRDWRIDDPTHDEFLRGVAKGHNVDEALQAGDLLNFLMVGGKELRLYDGGEYVPKTRWTEYLGPFLSKLPLGRGVEDLVGVHAKVLSLLPMKNYNHYTIAEIFADHPDLRNSLLGEPVLLAPIEFKALTALQSIVDSGSIGQFKLALSKGSSQGLRDLARSRDGSIGGVVMSAFKLASAAVGAFKTGDYKNAKELMFDLQRQYGIGAGSFASHEESMFIATLSSLATFTTNKDRVLSVKGNARQVLMAYDTTFTTDAANKGTPAQAALAAKIVAQEGAWKYDGRNATRSGLKNTGTNGLRLFTSVHKGSGDRGNSGQPTNVSLLSTDWLAIFYAITKCEEFVDADGTPLDLAPLTDVEKGVFENADNTLEDFDKPAAGKGQIDNSKVKGYIKKNEDKDGKKYTGRDDWKDLAKAKMGNYANPNWDHKKIKAAYPEADHPELYRNKTSVSEYAGNEPMYRFLIYSDLQSGGGILGNFMPQGTLTVILRATGAQASEQNFKSFEADLFYESYYTGDSLNKLLPTIEQGGDREDAVDLEGMSMSKRARRRGRANPPSPLLPIYAGNPDNVKRNEGVIFSEVQIGRNVVKDVGEAVQSVYRGLIGGRTSIAEKRMAMAIATMQKELSDRAMEKNANAVGNLKIDYELVQGSATLTIIAHADALVVEGLSVMVMPNPPWPHKFRAWNNLQTTDKDYSEPVDVGPRYQEALKTAQEVANHIGKELFLYFYDGSEKTVTGFSYYIILRSNAAQFNLDLDKDTLPNHKPQLIKPSRQARKKSSSKKPASGNMISIELTPRSQVQLSTVVDKADWLKSKMKEDKSGKLKALWNEYAKGDNPKPVFTDGIITAIQWRGKNYKFSQAELKGGKNTNKKRRKVFPASLVKTMGGKGTYADYKGGQANMRMIYAKRIDNGRLVPFRINIPKILLRKRANKVIPKDGGHKKGVKLLLDTIETNFGAIDLDTRFESSGGYDTYKKDRVTGEFLTDKKGNKILNVPVDRGIHLLYQASGLDTEGAYSTNAYPAYSRGGKIVYRAMSFDGQPVDMEVTA